MRLTIQTYNKTAEYKKDLPPILFEKQFWLSLSLAHFYFAKDRQKIKKLNANAQQTGVLSALFAGLAPLSQVRKTQAYGFL